MSKKPDNTRDGAHQKSQRIQVFARTRPLNASEAHSHNVLEVYSEKKEIRIKHGKTINKAFAFDGVFGPETKQVQVYKAVVEPLIQEVLMGYNCTVFAYGQTSTGKTFTMEGERSDLECDWDKDPNAGIIPRSLHQLFEELYKEESVEFSVHVSFLELYNEELFDLLSPNDVQHMSRLKLYEDANRKGSVVIQGLEEIKVNSKDEVYAILERGTQRRQTAATLLNTFSSRSHTIFSVTVHIKENTIDGEELLKTGKLNLVDLAGSENIGRSGATQKSAREAGNINQSLLTLGRVITSLVEKQPHVPYRESKLTRLLQDSLGGHTKTSIIATVSPAYVNIDETISTLDYAQRAKSITIKPEVNQKTTKRALMKEYTEEIERLRKDLVASRDKSGVYLHAENYAAMMNDITVKTKAIEDLTAEKEKLVEDLDIENKKVITLEKTLQMTKHQLSEMTNKCNRSESKCQNLIKKCEKKSKTLRMTRQTLQESARQRDENQYIINIQSKTEEKLSQQAQELLEAADESTKDVFALHDKVIRKTDIEKENEIRSEKFCVSFKRKLNEMNKSFAQVANEQTENLNSVCADIGVVLDLCNKYYSDFVNLNNSESCLGTFFSKFDRRIKCNVELFSADHENHTKFYNFNVKRVKDLKSLNKKLLEELNALQMKDSNVRNSFISKISNLKQLLLKVHDQTTSKIKELEAQFKLSNEMHQKQTQDFSKQFQLFCELLKSENKCQQDYTMLMETEDDELHQHLEGKVDTLKSEFIATIQKLTDMNMNLQKLSDIAKTHHANKTKKYSEIKEMNTHSAKRIKLEEEKLNNTVTYWMQEKDEKQKQLEDILNVANEEGEVNKNELSEGCSSIIQECENEKTDFKMSYRTGLNYITQQEGHLTEVNNTTVEETNALTKNWNRYQDHIEEFKTKTVEQLSDMESKLSTYRDYVVSRFQQQTDSITQSVNLVVNKANVMNKNFTERGVEVQTFFSSTLKKDKPTGLTPVKRDYAYPRIFVATSPPERLLKRYRDTLSVSEASAEKLSLNTSSDSSFDSCSSDIPPGNSKGNLIVPSSNILSSDDCFETCTPYSSLSDFNCEDNKSKENLHILGQRPSRLPRRKSVKKKFFPKPRPVLNRKPLTSANNMP